MFKAWVFKTWRSNLVHVLDLSGLVPCTRVWGAKLLSPRVLHCELFRPQTLPIQKLKVKLEEEV